MNNHKTPNHKKNNHSWKRRGPQERRWALIEVCPSNGCKRPQLCLLFWPAEHTSALLSFKLWGGKSDIWGALYKTRSAKDLLYHLKSLCQSLESCHLAGRYRQATGWQVGINEKSMTAAEAEMGGKKERDRERQRGKGVEWKRKAQRSLFLMKKCAGGIVDVPRPWHGIEGWERGRREAKKKSGRGLAMDIDNGWQSF